MEDDRGHLERRLADVEDVLRRGNYRWTVAQIAEARDAIGAARWAIGQVLRHVAGMTPTVDPDAPSGGLADRCDCVRALLHYALESLKGDG